MIRGLAASWRILLAAAAVVLAVGAVALAFDLRAWQRSLAAGDRRFETAPRSATWSASTILPGDTAAVVLGVRDDLALRRAVQAFVVASQTGRGFDNGQQRADARAEAESLLSDLGLAGTPPQASQANDLLGVLAASGGGITDGSSAAERSLGYFDTAVRLRPENTAARFNLELALRRLQAIATRQGPGSGTSRGTGRRGAGSGSAGSGY